MTDRESLLAAVREEPFDFARLLVYADWLAENGEDDTRIRRCVAGLRAAEAVPEQERSGDRKQIENATQRLDSVAQRLFLVACCRRPELLEQFSDPRSVQALGTAFGFACGIDGDEVLAVANNEAWAAYREGDYADEVMDLACDVSSNNFNLSFAVQLAAENQRKRTSPSEYGHQLAMLEAIREAMS